VTVPIGEGKMVHRSKAGREPRAWCCKILRDLLTSQLTPELLADTVPE
jgi:hypothetical protein